MGIIIENADTGETKVIEKDASGKYPKMSVPWRVLNSTHNIEHQSVMRNVVTTIQSALAVYATKAKLPVPEFLDTARWLLDKDCPACEMVTQLLRRIEDLGPEKAMNLVARIKIAKDLKDETALAAIRLEIQYALNRPR